MACAVMAAFRRELLAALPETLPRPPALRRASSGDALLATDLPLFAPEAAARLPEALPRWRFAASPNGWLLADPPYDAPDTVTVAFIPGEAGWLLRRLTLHPGAETDLPALRALLKAAEQSPAALEHEAGRLHRLWAGRLRKHQPLPGALLPWLTVLCAEAFCSRASD